MRLSCIHFCTLIRWPPSHGSDTHSKIPAGQRRARIEYYQSGRVARHRYPARNARSTEGVQHKRYKQRWGCAVRSLSSYLESAPRGHRGAVLTTRADLRCPYTTHRPLRHALIPITHFHCSSVVIRFQPTGNAPILKQKFYKITAANKFQTVIAFLRKELGWKPQDSLVSLRTQENSTTTSLAHVQFLRPPVLLYQCSL